MDYTKIKQQLKETLSEEKYNHSLETAENAKKIAKIINYKDVEKAYLAALLHDCAKCMKKDELFQMAQNLDFVTQEEKNMPKTLHAPIGAYVAKKHYGIEDDEILSAIRYHTIARRNMTDLEMIVFLSDKIRQEFGIKYFGTDAFEYIEKNGIEKAMLKAIKNGIAHLANKGALPTQITVDALEYFSSFLQSV